MCSLGAEEIFMIKSIGWVELPAPTVDGLQPSLTTAPKDVTCHANGVL